MALLALYERLTPCFELSSIDGNDVMDWTHNNNSEVIEVMPYPYMQLQHKQLNASHYRWCGPALLMIEYFAKFSNTKYIEIKVIIFL